MAHQIPIVAIVGRPNVGKSTLFNRLAGRKQAIVLDRPGMTRDRLMQRIDFDGRPVYLVDTGGYYVDREDGTVEQQMREQADIAVEEADAIIFLLDVEHLDNPDDHVLLERLRRDNKPYIVAVNKCDNSKRQNEAQEFYKLGVENLIAISALHNHDIGELMEAVNKVLPPHFKEFDEQIAQDEKNAGAFRFAIIGRPNVGKSTLVNAIVGEERVIANPMPGTTRDSIDTEFERDGRHYTIIDTAGLRRRGKVSKGAEMLSAFSALRSLDRCHACIVLLDGKDGITAQDQHIAGYAAESRRGCLIVVNKWDLLKGEENIHQKWAEEIEDRLKFLSFSPWVGVSAKTGKGVQNIFPVINSIYSEYMRKIDTPELNKFLEIVTAKNPPSPFKNKIVKMKYITQTFYAPPVFTIFVNYPEAVHFSYVRYLKNQFYKRFGFIGCPITFRFRQK
jgi:GTP-binding protein